MIQICYKCGKKIFGGESVQELADYIVETTGMNKNPATMYLYAIHGMFNATIYKRAVSAKALKIYYDNILKDYGSEGLKKLYMRPDCILVIEENAVKMLIQ